MWITGTVMKDRSKDNTLKGNSWVPSYNPKILINPGDIIVMKPLSWKLRRKYKITIFHFCWQNIPTDLNTKSIIAIITKVGFRCHLSPKYPHKGAPNNAETVIIIAQPAK